MIDYMISCYNNNNFTDLINYLTDDCVYRSQWVFDEMHGKDKISNYLIAKSETIERCRAFPHAKKVRIIKPFAQDAIAITQGSDEVKIILLLGIYNDKIKSIDLCMPELFLFE